MTGKGYWERGAEPWAFVRSSSSVAERVSIPLICTPSSVIGHIKQSWHEQHFTLLSSVYPQGSILILIWFLRYISILKRECANLSLGAFKYFLSRTLSQWKWMICHFGLWATSWKLSMNEPDHHEQIDLLSELTKTSASCDATRKQVSGEASPDTLPHCNTKFPVTMGWMDAWQDVHSSVFSLRGSAFSGTLSERIIEKKKNQTLYE